MREAPHVTSLLILHLLFTSYTLSRQRLEKPSPLFLLALLSPSPLFQRPPSSPHTLFFKAETGKAFTTFLAGFAFTITTFPKTSLFPALVAGLKRVLILQTPGMVNTPVLFTSCVAISARLFRICPHTLFFISVLVDSASAMPPFVMALAFIAFIGAIDVRAEMGASEELSC